MPRWRRPSLKTARYETPKIAALPAPAMTFARATSSGLERRIVRYDLVALTDIPDEIRGVPVGQLQANDEVELLERRGAWVQVRTPLGAEGWIHRTTLQSPDTVPATLAPRPVAPPPPRVIDEPAPPPADEPGSIESDVAIGAFAAAAAKAARERELEAAAVRPTPVTAEPSTSADEVVPEADPVATPKTADRPRTRRRSPARTSPNP